MVSRRDLIGGAAATALATFAAPAAIAAATRMVGYREGPYRSDKFSGAGFYAFGGAGVIGKRVMHADIDDNWGIALSEGPGEPVEVYVSHRSFDRVCWGRCFTQDEAEQKAGTGRHRRIA